MNMWQYCYMNVHIVALTVSGTHLEVSVQDVQVMQVLQRGQSLLITVRGGCRASSPAGLGQSGRTTPPLVSLAAASHSEPSAARPGRRPRSSPSQCAACAGCPGRTLCRTRCWDASAARAATPARGAGHTRGRGTLHISQCH